MELGESPISNDEGLREYIECAVKSGVHYLGFNFPKDVCSLCGATGVFDRCPVCGGSDITRIRRVSGYLEVLDGFTSGKKTKKGQGGRIELIHISVEGMDGVGKTTACKLLAKNWLYICR